MYVITSPQVTNAPSQGFSAGTTMLTGVILICQIVGLVLFISGLRSYLRQDQFWQ